MYVEIILPDGTEKKLPIDKSIEELYYKLGRINEKKYEKTEYKEIKKALSQSDTLIPLFDIFSKNIYIINGDNVYNRVTNFHYRLPTKITIQRIKDTLDKIEDERLIQYKEKLMKNVTFMNNFDYKALEQNYYKLFFQSQPSTSELTTCIKPSFIPFMTSKPYYSKSELINLGLNMNLKLDDNIESICKIVSENDINSNIILKHQLYIKNVKTYVQLYSLLGSSYWNHYLRTQNFKDPYVEKEIYHLYNIVDKAPSFAKSHWLYRFIDSDMYLDDLKIGDIFEEKSFISTTRNPFYNTQNNVFGFILIKILIPGNIKGVGICLESYSLFPEEEEILLNPAKLKLISKDKNFKYYHNDTKAGKRIKKLYEFEYVDKLPITHIEKYEEYGGKIPYIDWLHDNVEGNDFASKVYHFYKSVIPQYNNKRYFYSNIGKMKYMFTAFYLDDNPIYEKYFFLQKDKHNEKEEIYFLLQNDKGEILLIIELRDIISVNYLHRYVGSIPLPFTDNELLLFLSSMAHYFNISQVIIHDEYKTYDKIATELLKKTRIAFNDFNPDNHVISLYSGDFRYYNENIINHIENNNKRFQGIDSVTHNLKNHHFARFRTISAKKLFEVVEKSELYNILLKIKKEQTLLQFYIYIHYNYFYLIPELNNLIIIYDNELFTDMLKSPWTNSYTMLNSEHYLYENKHITHIRTFKTNVFQDYLKKLGNEHKSLTFNKYRLGLV